jgi:hypothetical protein
LISAFGADEAGGPVLVGIMPHTTLAEVEQLIAGLQKLIRAGVVSPNGANGARESGASWPANLSVVS